MFRRRPAGRYARPTGITLAATIATATLCACGGGHGASVVPAASTAGTSGIAQSLMSSAQTNITATSMTTVALQSGASAVYPMTDLSTTLTDAGPAHVNGTQGSMVVKGVAGLTKNTPVAVTIPGGAYNMAAFDWTPPNAALQPTSAITVEAWVKVGAINATGNVVPIVSYGVQSPSGLAYTIQMRSPFNQLQFRVRVNSAKYYVVAYGQMRLAVNNCYHVVATYDGAQAQIYINGVPDGNPGIGSGAVLYYPGVKGQYGLAIGGTPQNTYAQPNVTVGNVAIYPTALPSATIQQHYLSGVATPIVTQTPVRSQTFVDSIAANTHFGYSGTHWDTSFPAIQSLLVASGIRHIRDTLVTTWTPYYARINQLGAAGVKGDLVVGRYDTPAQIVTAATSSAKGSIEAFEGVNEPDLDGAGWDVWARSTQQMLYSTVKSNPALALYPVISTSVTAPSAAQLLGNLSPYMDYGNLHNYYGQDNPGSPGYGGYHAPWGWGGSAAFNLAWVSMVSGTKPVMTTETGYGTQVTLRNGISQNAQAKYMPRLFLEQFRAGIARTYVYEFIDEPYVVGQGFDYNGFVDVNLQPKPSYYAMQSMISTLSDPGSYTFSPTPLRYSVDGNVNNVHTLLTQKHDGTYQLAFWLEVQDWDGIANVELFPQPQSITLGLTFTPSSAQLMTQDSAGHGHTTAASFSGHTLALTVSDRVSIISFK